MILGHGEKLHVIIRRRFERDMRRHFVGEAIHVEGSVARVEGYSFILDTASNQWVRKPEKLTRLIGLADAGVIISILPLDADLDNIIYTRSLEKRLVATDGQTFTLDINEFGSMQ